jgi:hypothetical protein
MRHLPPALHAPRIAPRIALAVLALGACATSRAGTVHGEWGAPGARLEARESGGILAYGCRIVELEAPLVADARGDVRVRGTARASGGAPPPPGGPPTWPVEIRGRRLRDERLRLVVATPGTTSGDTLVLRPGVMGTVVPCP